MRQHALDDAVGPIAVLGDFFEVAGQHRHDLIDLGASVRAQRAERRLCRLLEFVEQLHRERCEIVDEIERILDFVGNARGQLTERGHLLGVNQTGLRRP